MFVKVLTGGQSDSVSFPVRTTCILDRAQYNSNSVVVPCRNGSFLSGIDRKLPHNGQLPYLNLVSAFNRQNASTYLYSLCHLRHPVRSNVSLFQHQSKMIKERQDLRRTSSSICGVRLSVGISVNDIVCGQPYITNILGRRSRFVVEQIRQQLSFFCASRPHQRQGLYVLLPGYM